MRDRVNEQLGQALDQFDDPDMTLSSHIRRAIRIAGLSNDYENLYWLELEMRSIENNTDWTRIATEFAAHWPADKRSEIESAVWDTYRRERGYHERDVLGKPIKEKRCQRGVEQIEADIVKFSEAIDELRSDLQASEGGLHDVMRQARLASLRKYRANAEDYNRILLKIRTRVHTFLSSVERETAYSDANAGIFEHYRSYVDGKLSALAPKVLGQFVAAYQRVAEGHPESLSQAVLSCRRILKSLADHVYPPNNGETLCSDGKRRRLTSDRFINRLLEFISTNKKGEASSKLLLAQVGDLDNRLNSLNELCGKGVHADIPIYEVYQCIVQTYLSIGDILRLTELPQQQATLGPGLD